MKFVFTGVLAFGLAFGLYWLCGGDFERNWKLGFTVISGFALWGHLLTTKQPKDPTPQKGNDNIEP